MTDKISKQLAKLTLNERQQIKTALIKIEANQIENLDVKKLKGRDDIYRVRVRNMRIVFRSSKSQINVLAIERRSDQTYRNY